MGGFLRYPGVSSERSHVKLSRVGTGVEGFIDGVIDGVAVGSKDGRWLGFEVGSKDGR